MHMRLVDRNKVGNFRIENAMDLFLRSIGFTLKNI